MEKLSKAIIDERYKIFNEAKGKIKNEFYGIDNVIDEVFKAIETWYIYPEFMTRPCVINLWGLTGVGKTDLVQKIRTYLKIDKFATTEMDNNSNGAEESVFRTGFYGASNSKSIFNLLAQYEIDPASHAILLLDEIHRFRTIDAEGKPVLRNRYGDIWKLLSDGVLYDNGLVLNKINEIIEDIQAQYDSIRLNTSRQTEDIQEKIGYMFGNIAVDEKKLAEEKKKKDETIKKLGYLPYEYRRENQSATEYDNFTKGISKGVDITNLIFVLNDIDDEDIKMLKQLKYIYQGQEDFIVNEVFLNTSKIDDEKTKLIKYFHTCSNRVILEWLKYKKKKILERFSKLDAVELRNENIKYIYSKLLIFICGNTEKEMYSKENKKLTKDIRKYMSELFRAEQVSRFGNNYIEYPILDKSVYDKVIMNEIKFTEERLNREYGTDKIKFDHKEIYDLVIKDLPDDYIYNGIRPIFSAVQRVLSTKIPSILINIFEKE